jgi:hypothetical protein
MSELSKYWKLVRIDAAESGRGYKLEQISPAQEFFVEKFPDPGDRQGQARDKVQRTLMQLSRTFIGKEENSAELCLRCYVSYPILQACQNRARLFGSGNGFTYRDLLPFVLNDDGKPQKGTFIPFSVEILNSFSLEHHCSLARWTDLRVRRNPEMNHFLLEQGLRFCSDWALLNRVDPKNLEAHDRHLVEVFHQVYRRDRPQQHRQGIRQKCFDPTDNQLQEMQLALCDRQMLIHSSQSLLSQLKRIAYTLRQEEIWGRRGYPLTEPLEITDPDTGETNLKEIPDQTYINDPEAKERLELQAFCYKQLLDCLDQGIRGGIGEHIRSLEQRPRYAHFAHKVKSALRLLYFENKSQSQIAVSLGMTNQAQVSRVLNPKDLLLSIRHRTIAALLHRILEKVKELGIVESPMSPDYLSNLMQQLDVFVDEQIFQAALAEINASRNRSMSSLYAQHLRQILDKQEVSPAA